MVSRREPANLGSTEIEFFLTFRVLGTEERVERQGSNAERGATALAGAVQLCWGGG